MSRNQVIVTAAAGVAVLLLALYVFTSPEAASETAMGIDAPPADCVQSVAATPADPAGVTVVLIDRTASTRGTTGSRDYVAAARPGLLDAVERGDTVVFSAFDGTAATIQWTKVHTAFHGSSDQVLLAQADAVRCLQDNLLEIAQSPAGAAETDVLGALQAARSQLVAAPDGSRHVLLATDGLATTGCADVNNLSPGGQVTAVVDRCRQTEELPALSGTDVRMLGIGLTDPAQPPMSSVQLQWLRTLWDSLCSAAGASPCAVDQTVDVGPAHANSPGTPADTQIVWPVVDINYGPGEITITLPDRLLFDTDSDQLRPDASGALSEVAATVQRSSGSIVRVVGHTDGRGDPEYNRLLSVGRAQRIADALQQSNGLTVGEVIGMGATAPKCSPETRPDGTFDTVALQCNRRVEVVVRAGSR